MLLIYGGINFYIYRRVIGSAALTGGWDWGLKFGLLLLIAAFFLGRSLGSIEWLATPLIWIGSVWFAVMAYALLLCLLIDVARVINWLAGWFPNWITSDLLRAGRITLLSGIAVIGITLGLGYIASLKPTVKEINLTMPKLPQTRNSYRIAYFADVHLGCLVGPARLERVVEQVNSLNPDLILIGGDVVDEPPKRLQWAVEPLRRLKARDGVFAALGNHEFYDGLAESVELLQRAGMQVLRNSTYAIPGVICIAGLDDASAARQFGQRLASISEVIQDGDLVLPVVLLHHTPTRYKEAAEAGVDLMLCGHTHGGQLWPFDYITRAVYGVKRGFSRIKDMNFYLTTGAGTWGPPMRVGAAPEIVVFIMTNTNPNTNVYANVDNKSNSQE